MELQLFFYHHLSWGSNLKIPPRGGRGWEGEWCQLLGDGYTISTLSKATGAAEVTESGLDFILVSFPENHCQFQENPHRTPVPLHQRLIKTELFDQLCGTMALKSAWRRKGSDKSPDVHESKWQQLWSFPGLNWKSWTGAIASYTFCIIGTHWSCLSSSEMAPLRRQGCSCVKEHARNDNVVFIFKNIYYLFVCMCICLPARACRSLQRPKGGIWGPGSGVIFYCELPYVRAQNWTLICKSSKPS